MANIKSDAQFHILNNKDKHKWTSGEAKRQWHIREARLEVYRQLANSGARREADPIALLNHLDKP